MNLLDGLEKLITEHGSAAILRERIALIRDQAQSLEKQASDLQRENGTLKERVAVLEAQLASKTAFNEFVECRGALFKRKPTGGYHTAVFCPSCRGPMSSLEKVLPYHCRCGVEVDFTGDDLETVMSSLP